MRDNQVSTAFAVKRRSNFSTVPQLANAMKPILSLSSLLLVGVVAPSFVAAQVPITLADVEEGLPEISADEPIAVDYSAKRAAQYLDRSALNWQKTKKCATCHTNLFYLAARPALGTILPDSGEVRAFYEDYRKVRWKKKLPTETQGFWPIVVGAGLTINDAQSTGELSEVAREVLDIMWTVQREDGGWRWPDCDYAPIEIDDHYGVTIAALTVGIAPNDYANSPQARAGLIKLRKYFNDNPPKSLHHRAMLAWCSVRVDGIATESQRKETLAQLLTLQLDDGGWSTSGLLSDWKGLTGSRSLDTKTSDGYGTGFVMVVARELGLPADDGRLRRGVDWLRANQRVSGKWFTRSPVNECGNLMSNVGSAYAILAMQACGELPSGVFGQTKRKLESP
jgi:squalene-hopene/tetraprenyl-beta-curcumene cyclase